VRRNLLRGRIALPLVLAAFLIAGCVGQTDPATQITATGATLNAHGHTDNGPAYWWWEYSDVKANLGTPRGARVCGTAIGPGAHCGPAQATNDVHLETRVEDLRPGTTYYFRACGQDAGSTQAACAGIMSFATAAITCVRWASSAANADDTNPGTQASPYRSLDKLVRGVAAIPQRTPGQAGCLAANQDYYAVDTKGIVGGQGTAQMPVIITSGAGGRATVKGLLDFQPQSQYIVVRNLNFRGKYYYGNVPLPTRGPPHIVVRGDRIAFVDNDITNPRSICITVGRQDDVTRESPPGPDDAEADDVRFIRNRIHDCGIDDVPAPLHSGSHGLYLEYTLRARVIDNLIYNNKWRGVQLYPRNDGALIAYNVLDGNATQVNIGSSQNDSGPFVAKNTVVRDNILSNRVTDFDTSRNPSQVFGNFKPGPDTYGNQVYDNCYAPGDPFATGYGYLTTAANDPNPKSPPNPGDNVAAQPLYVNRGAADYRLQSSSPAACMGKGPPSIQP
jgi:hypothetical protein